MWQTEHIDLIFFNKVCMMQLLKDVIDDISVVTPLRSTPACQMETKAFRTSGMAEPAGDRKVLMFLPPWVSFGERNLSQPEGTAAELSLVFLSTGCCTSSVCNPLTV